MRVNQINHEIKIKHCEYRSKSDVFYDCFNITCTLFVTQAINIYILLAYYERKTKEVRSILT